MKRIALLLSLILLVGVSGGCGKKMVSLKPGIQNDIVVFSQGGPLPGQTEDQKVELNRVIQWMDIDIVKSFKRSGFNAVLIKKKEEYNPQLGKLLVISVDDFKAGNRAARAFVGFGAGGSSLDLSYVFSAENGELLEDWKDGVGSSQGGTYCAQTLNRNTIEKIVNVLNR